MQVVYLGHKDYAALNDDGSPIGYRQSHDEAQALIDEARMAAARRSNLRMPVVYNRDGSGHALKQQSGKHEEMRVAYRRIISRGACVAFRYYEV